jgi:ATP-dependent helicase HrpA
MTFLKSPDDPKTSEELNARYSACKQQLPSTANTLRRHIVYILSETARLEHLATTLTGIYPETTEDVLDQLAWLVYDGFIAATPALWLERYPMLLQAINNRLERARNNPAGDRKKMAAVQPLWQRYTDFVVREKKPRHDARRLSDYRWAIESLRIGTFNPTMQPFERTSEKKLEGLWQEMLRA